MHKTNHFFRSSNMCCYFYCSPRFKPQYFKGQTGDSEHNSQAVHNSKVSSTRRLDLNISEPVFESTTNKTMVLVDIPAVHADNATAVKPPSNTNPFPVSNPTYETGNLKIAPHDSSSEHISDTESDQEAENIPLIIAETSPLNEVTSGELEEAGELFYASRECYYDSPEPEEEKSSEAVALTTSVIRPITENTIASLHQPGEISDTYSECNNTSTDDVIHEAAPLNTLVREEPATAVQDPPEDQRNTYSECHFDDSDSEPHQEGNGDAGLYEDLSITPSDNGAHLYKLVSSASEDSNHVV